MERVYKKLDIAKIGDACFVVWPITYNLSILFLPFNTEHSISKTLGMDILHLTDSEVMNINHIIVQCSREKVLSYDSSFIPSNAKDYTSSCYVNGLKLIQDLKNKFDDIKKIDDLKKVLLSTTYFTHPNPRNKYL